MSREAALLRRLARALKEIADLSEVPINSDAKSNNWILPDEGLVGARVTIQIKVGLDHAAEIARKALVGIVVT